MHCKMEYTVNFKISKEQKNMHRESIEIPCGIQRLYLEVQIPDEFRYMGFILAEDPSGTIRLQKLLGHGEQNIGIGSGAEDTTIGGVPGVIQNGTWKIGLGIFTEYVEQKLGNKSGKITVVVSDKNAPVSDPIGGDVWVEDGLKISDRNYSWQKVFADGPAWYKGDFHTHTRLSDGKESIESAVKKADIMNMDFYVPTEHNLMHTGWCPTSLCVLPGIEITSDEGHMNLFGITEMPAKVWDIVSHNGEEIVRSYMQETIDEAEKKGWITSINHPFLTIWKWKFENTRMDQINCIEIINDPTYPDAPDSNDRAVRFLDGLWKEGYRIYGVGGSDSHNLTHEFYEGASLPSIAGDPGTYVFCPSLTPENLMKAVRQGHMYVSRFCELYPEIKADGTAYLPGDEIPASECMLDYRMAITGLSEKPEVYLVTDGDYVKLPVQQEENEQYTAEIRLALEDTAWQWIRMEVRSRKQELLGYVNPVYRGRKEPKFRTFGEILKNTEGLSDD